MNSSLERWKKAVIHLECATDSISSQEQSRRWSEAAEWLRKGEISHEDYSELTDFPSRDVRYHGTAVFLRHEGQHFLVTAYHVLHDKLAAEAEIEEKKQDIASRLYSYDEEDLRRACESANERVCHLILRVPSLDEYLHHEARGYVENWRPNELLMNIDAAKYEPLDPSLYHPQFGWVISPAGITFSDLDLAVVSLNTRDQCLRLAKELLCVGHQPITFDDIVDEPSSEGAEVLAIGFPHATAILRQRIVEMGTSWCSDAVSLPTMVFGRVSMLHPALPHFWCDLSTYPGSSGGPVIEGEKLVGIVCKQAVCDEEILPHEDAWAPPMTASIGIPFGQIVKASHIRPLVELQLMRDESFRRRKGISTTRTGV